MLNYSMKAQEWVKHRVNSCTNLFSEMKLKREQERFSSNGTSISSTPVNASMSSRKLRGTLIFSKNLEIGIELQRR